MLILTILCFCIAGFKANPVSIQSVPSFGIDGGVSGLGADYDHFRSSVTDLKVVDAPSKEGFLRDGLSGRKLQSTFSQVFEIRNTLQNGNIISSRGYTIDSCTCGYNTTSSINVCSLITASGPSASTYTLTFSYYNSATSCSGVPSRTYTATYAPSTASYRGCFGGQYTLSTNYAISSSSVYNDYPTGLVAFHYGNLAACTANNQFTDFKFSGFSACGDPLLPCGDNTTYSAVSSTAINIQYYKDGSCNVQNADTTISASRSCFSGSFDDDISIDVVQDYFTWLVLGAPGSSKTVTLSKQTYSGLVAAVFIAFLVGIFFTAAIFHCAGNRKQQPLAKKGDGVSMNQM